MPTYEYECKSCNYVFEAFQGMSEPPLTSCPQCGKEIRRLINGGSGIIFKGSGFYVTDKKSGTSTVPAKTSAKPEGDGQTASAAAEPAGGAQAEAPASAGKESGSLEKQATG